jgi:hypothetical protein
VFHLLDKVPIVDGVKGFGEVTEDTISQLPLVNTSPNMGQKVKHSMACAVFFAESILQRVQNRARCKEGHHLVEHDSPQDFANQW